MAAPAELPRRLKAEGLQIAPLGGVAGHRDVVLVAQDDAGAIEHAPDRRIGLPRDFRLGAPDRPQNGGDLERRDLMHGPVEQRTGIGRAKVALPLVLHLFVGRLCLRVGNHQGGDLAERGDGPGGLLGCLPRDDGIQASFNLPTGLAGLLAGLLEADLRI